MGAALGRQPEDPGTVVGVLHHRILSLLVERQGHQARHLDLQLSGLWQVTHLHLAVRFARAAIAAPRRPLQFAAGSIPDDELRLRYAVATFEQTPFAGDAVPQDTEPFPEKLQLGEGDHDLADRLALCDRNDALEAAREGAVPLQ